MKWVIRIAGSLIVLIGIAGAYLASLDVNQYKDALVELVEGRTGRDFSIHGDIRLKISLLPTIAADGIAFGNVKSAARENMVTVQRAEAQLALLPLLSADIALKRLTIIGAHISIETDSKGRGNWILEIDDEPDDSQASETMPRFDLDQVTITRTVIEYRGYGRDAREIDIKNLQLRPNGFGQPLNVGVEAVVDELQLGINGSISPIKRLLANEPYAIDLNGSAGEARFTTKGELQEPLVGRGIKLDITMRSPQLALLSAPFDVPLSDHGPVDFKTTVTDTTKGYSLQNMRLQVADSVITGDLTVAAVKDRWRINGKVTAPQIDTRDFAAGDTDATPSDRIFSQQAQSFDWLEQIEVGLDLAVDQLISNKLAVSKIAIYFSIDDGVMEIKPLSADIGGGKLTAEVEMEVDGDRLHTKLDLSIVGMSLAKLPALAEGSRVTGGMTDVILTVDGKGSSLADIMASANGIAFAKTGATSINNDAAGLAGADLVMSLLDHLNPLSSVDNTTEVECVAVRFPIVNGVASNDTGIGVLTNKLAILGGGTVDLRTEKIDIGAKPKPREGLGLNLTSLADFVRLGGTLSNPQVKTDAKGAATAGIKVGAAVATVGLSILAEGIFDRVTADADVCAIARGEASVDGANGESAADQSVLKSTTDKTKNAIKGAGAKVKGVFKGLFGN